jgi:hypothetical protein
MTIIFGKRVCDKQIGIAYEYYSSCGCHEVARVKIQTGIEKNTAKQIEYRL